MLLSQWISRGFQHASPHKENKEGADYGHTPSERKVERILNEKLNGTALTNLPMIP
jgi:hypothetical protein